MARADRQWDQSRESQTQKIRSLPPQLGAFGGVLIHGNLLPQCENLGGQAEPGHEERSDQKINRLDDAHEEVSQSWQDTAILPGMKKERYAALCPKIGANVTVPGSGRSVADVKP